MDLQRLALIKNARDASISLPFADVDLIFRHLGYPEAVRYQDWEDTYDYSPSPEDRRSLIGRLLSGLSSQEIAEYSEALRLVFGQGDDTTAAEVFREAQPLQLFASHLHEQAGLVRDVAEQLDRSGVGLFVAHVDIEPGDDWHRTIELNLSTCDGGVAFLRPGFIESRWCDQEVGWLLGRPVPVLGIRFSQDPYGPLGRVQAIAGDGRSVAALASAILAWVAAQPQLSRQLVASTVEAMGASGSFSHSDELWARIRSSDDLTRNEVGKIATALRDNNQLRGESRLPGEPRIWLPEALLPFLVRQPGYAGNEELIREIATRLELDALLPGDADPQADPF